MQNSIDNSNYEKISCEIQEGPKQQMKNNLEDITEDDYKD